MPVVFRKRRQCLYVNASESENLLAAVIVEYVVLENIVDHLMHLYEGSWTIVWDKRNQQ